MSESQSDTGKKSQSDAADDSAGTFLDHVYEQFESGASSQEIYRDWARTYDREVADNGYITPRRCAQALAQLAADNAAPVLDVGCGTGLSGLALREAGFLTLDGVDFSEEMLQLAGARGIYRNLVRCDLAEPLPFSAGTQAYAVAAGVMHPGHAPPVGFDHVFEALGPGGIFVFSLNDHALADGQHEGRVRELTDCGYAELLFREYGEHLPALGLRAQVFALRRR